MIARSWLPALAAAGLLTAAVAPGFAQDYVTSTWVFLRRSPSMTGARLRALEPGDSLFVRAVDQRSGWLPVRTLDGKAGWVGESYLRNLAAMAAAAATIIVAGPGGAPFDAIDSTWVKPPIERSTMRVRSGTVDCGPTGDAAADDGTNLNKNRNNLPALSHLVTVDAIRALPDTALWRFKSRKNWTAADSALVLPYEGIPLSVEGFFEIVKPQDASPPTRNTTVGESPNCHSWDERDTDWHVALVAVPSETEERAVVVEPTPRTKRNSGWIPDSIARLAVRRKPSSPRNEANAARVRVTGFLMLDPVHPDHIRGRCTSQCAGRKLFRATLWEIHPVTRIEVLRNRQWVDLRSP